MPGLVRITQFVTGQQRYDSYTSAAHANLDITYVSVAEAACSVVGEMRVAIARAKNDKVACQ